MKGKNVLVTGGTGFVGSHLVEELIKQKVNIITTFQTLNPLSYFFTQKLDRKTTMVNCDVCDYEKVFDIVTKFNIDYIFHLAAQPLVDVAYHNPKRTLYSNILGTINVLESARLFPKVKAVIVASSDKAYGKHGKKQYTEEDALKGDHPYEVSKSSADLIAYSYYKTYSVPVVTTRFGNIYGEGDLNFSRIIPCSMKSLIDNEILE
ncbi:MAG TPA: GDP-mannose 4,6-dehydratase, partial [Patescibacteria group bacterium]|nr:GDP-mannose 4,6-dehydratase [Patescibacteria group bacterium]